MESGLILHQFVVSKDAMIITNAWNNVYKFECTQDINNKMTECFFAQLQTTAVTPLAEVTGGVLKMTALTTVIAALDSQAKTVPNVSIEVIMSHK